MAGEAIPSGTSDIYMCDGLRLMHENIELMHKLKTRQEKCMADVQDIESKLTAFRTK